MSYQAVILSKTFQSEDALNKIDGLLSDGYTVAFTATVQFDGTDRIMVYLHKKPERFDVTSGMRIDFKADATDEEKTDAIVKLVTGLHETRSQG